MRPVTRGPVEAQIERAWLATSLGRSALAERLAREVLGSDPFNARAMEVLAFALWDQGRREEAEAVACRAVGVAPRDPWLHNLLGHLRGSAPDAGLACFEEAVRLEPDNPHFLASLARALGTVRRYEPARVEDAARRALSLAPESDLVLTESAQAFDGVMRLQVAEDLLRRALAQGPESVRTRVLLLSVLRKLRGREAEREALARETLRLAPNDANVWAELAAAQVDLERWTEAGAALAELARLDAQHPGLAPVTARYDAGRPRPRHPDPDFIDREPVGQPGCWDRCAHATVALINPYESLRKYRCAACQGVMLCACDEDFARRARPHQMRQASGGNGVAGGPVDAGFQRAVCNACRGLPEEPAPLARGSVIARYYWREIERERWRRLLLEARSPEGLRVEMTGTEYAARVDQLTRELTAHFQALHRRAPKYPVPGRARSSR